MVGFGPGTERKSQSKNRMVWEHSTSNLAQDKQEHRDPIKHTPPPPPLLFIIIFVLNEGKRKGNLQQAEKQQQHNVQVACL